MSIFQSISDTDGAKTIRMLFVFKRTFSVERFLTQLHLPFSFLDIVQELSFDLKTNIQIEEIFTNVFTTMNFLVGCKLDIKTTFRKNLIIALLEVKIILPGTVLDFFLFFFIFFYFF